MEEPGAANCVLGLPKALASKGRRAAMYCGGSAVDYLRSRKARCSEVPPDTTSAGLLQNVRAKVVLVGTSANPQTFGLQLIEAANVLGVPSGGILDCGLNLEWRFRGTTNDPLHFAPRFLLCPDGATREAFLRMGFPPKRAFETGYPQLEAAAARGKELRGAERAEFRGRLFPAARAEATIATFVAESSRESLVEYRKTGSYTLQGRGKSAGRTEIVMEEFLAAAEPHRRNLYLVLRLHPRQSRQELEEYFPEFDQISVSEPPLDLLWACDFAVGLTSMLLCEAAAMGVLTVSVVPRAEEFAWLPGEAKGWTRAVCDREALKTAIQEVQAQARAGSKSNPRVERAGANARAAETLDGILTGRILV